MTAGRPRHAPPGAPWVAVAIGALLVLAPAAGSAQRRGRRRVRVRVVDVAADRVYVSPGADEGLHHGATVRFRRGRFRVTGVTASYAVLETGERRLSVGTRGVAIVRRRREGADDHRLPPPPALSSYAGQWPEPTLPAEGQSPDPVPLGRMGRARRLRVDVIASGYAFVPLRGADEPIGRGELRARVHAQPFRELPLTLDADAAVQLWLGRDLDTGPGERSRPYLRVRELQVAYGHQHDFHAALGRMRYAAATLGQLDGLRVQTPSLEGLTVAGFGGFVPDPESGRPRFDAARFGVEATYRDLESDLRPVVSLVGHGSVFDGEIDERRLSASFHLYPGESHVGGYVEVSAFDADNPWGAPEVDVTAASLDTTLRFDWLRIGARASMRQPERSKWLASFFEPGWFCTPLANTGGGPDECDGYYDVRLVGNADVGVEVDDVAVTGGATVIHVGTRSDLDQLGGFVAFRAVRLLGWGHLDASAMVSTSSVYETWALSASAGAAVIPEVIDFTLRYRPAVSRYTADVDYFVEHLVGGRVMVRPIPEIDVLLDADGMLGRQVDAFLVQLAVAWHGAF